MKAVVPTGKIYLGSPFYSDAQRERAAKAKELLAKNPSIAHVFFPFVMVSPIRTKRILKSAVSEARFGGMRLTKMI